MTKFDVANMGPGMVFEIVQQKDSIGYGNTYNDDTFMVISSVQANSRMDTVIVAPVIEYDDNNAFGVQFLLRRGGSVVTKTICIDRMFKIMKKRLSKLRYVVSPEVMKEVNKSIQNLFFGEALYTKEQAFSVAYMEEMALRVSNAQKTTKMETNIPIDGASYESVDFCEPEDLKPKSREEEEFEFARKMLSTPDPDFAVTNVTNVNPAEPCEKKEAKKPVSKKKPKSSIIIVSSQSATKKQVLPKPKEEENTSEKPKRSYGRYASIKKNWENFLLDYTILSDEELLDKYDIPDKVTLYRIGRECKSIAKDHGIDIREFRRNPNRVNATK